MTDCWLPKRTDVIDRGDGNAVWCDYLRDAIWGEYNVDPDTADATMGRTYLSARAHLDPGFEPVYYHHNHLGTTRLLSQADGQGGHELFSHVYSAFGQPITEPEPPVTRYGYVGAHGYEADLLTFEGAAATVPIELLHVGERWYDPSAGRFIQRDPIGLLGRLNVYEYVTNEPVNLADPAGLQETSEPPEYEDPADEHKDVILETEVVASSLTCLAGGLILFGGPGGAVTGGAILVGEGLSWCIHKVIELRNHRRTYRRKTSPPPPRDEPPMLVCFPEGTLVLTRDGLAEIESIRAGEELASMSMSAGRLCWSSVTQSFSGWAYDLVVLHLETETIRCTEEHPLWVTGKAWVRAADIQEGDQLLSASGAAIVVKEVSRETLAHPARVYNVTVRGERTYFVAESGVLVHNKPP